MNKNKITIALVIAICILLIGILVYNTQDKENISSSGNINNTTNGEEQTLTNETESESETETTTLSKEDMEKQTKEALASRLTIVSDYLSQSGYDKATIDFVNWLSDKYDFSCIEKLNTIDVEISSRDFYDNTGKSLFVLCDEFTENTDYIIANTASESELNMVFAGDICLAEDGFVLDYYDTVNDLKECVSPEILDITNSADIFMANNEFCISNKGAPLSGKMYTFRARPDRVSLLQEFGLDIVSLANNHIYDYGSEAFSDTITNLSNAGITIVGGGNNEEASKKVIYYEANGMKIGIIAASNAERNRYTPGAVGDAPGIFLMYDTTDLLNVVNSASKKCDFLIAFLHWGTEDSNKYVGSQHDLAVELKNNGADAIIGSHPHVLQGVEYIENVPVIYSMGDFWFNGETKYTGMFSLKIGIEGIKEMNFIPCIQTNYKCQYIIDATMKNEVLAYMNSLSTYCQFDQNGKAVNNFYD